MLLLNYITVNTKTVIL